MRPTWAGPISDIASNFADDDLLPTAREVLRDLAPHEKEVVSDDGRWFLRRTMLYRTLDHRTDGVVITFADITERKQAADAVIRRLAAIVDSSADTIISKDLDGTIRTWNPGAERLYGYHARKTLGRSIRSTIPEDRLDEWTTAMAQLACGQHIEDVETIRLGKDGQRIPVALTYSPLHDSSGKIVGASVIARSLSERHRDERATLEGQRRMQAILNTAADAIITIDQGGLIQSVNPAAESMFGYSAADLLGRNVNLLMPSPYREEHDNYLARYLQASEAHIIGIGREVQGRRKDGSVFPLDLAVSEVEPRQLFTSIVRDVSRRKELELEVLETPPWSSAASARICTTTSASA